MNLTEEVSIDQIVDWLRFQEEKGLTLKDCINKLEMKELVPTLDD